MPHVEEAHGIATRWLQALDTACVKADATAFQQAMLPDGVYRDLLCLSWDFRTLSGRDAVGQFLREDDRLAQAVLYDFAIDKSTDFGLPFFYPIPGAPPGVSGIQLSFKFKLRAPPAVAKGLARLMQDPRDGRYKAFTLFTSLHDICGHEEIVGARPVPRSMTWGQFKRERIERIETDPTVLIVGAAQNGLLTAARLGQMGLSALVVEREAHVGDSWRQRYDLKLHTYSRICSFLYESYPTNFPLYMPRDRLADALEAYVTSQDLVVWTSSTVLPSPTYDEKSRRWSVVVMREGKEVRLRPKYIVMATGFAGEPNMPSWPGENIYKGVIYHSGRHPGGQHFAGKNVVVVGAGQSAADMCVDFVRHGAGNITMLQRSATCVMSLPVVEKTVYSHWPETRSIEDSDFAVNAFPQSLLLRLAAGGGTAMEKEADKDMHDGLRKAGFELTWGQELGKGEIGMFGILLHRFGGYWIDQGCAPSIASGRIAVKHGHEIARYDEDGVVLTDGSKIPADVVVLATGYKGIRHTAAKIFGEDLISKTTEVWGIDDEGETRGMYRPSGHPGLFYAVGGFNHARFYSRHLGLQILARELGLKA